MKRKIGTLNVATGQFTKETKVEGRKRRSARDSLNLPANFVLAKDEYERLRELVEWFDATPDYIELDDHLSEEVAERMSTPLEGQVPKGYWAASVQVETMATAPDIAMVGLLVALVEHEDDPGETEVHVPIYAKPNARR
jgi:hypothetical protein